MCGIAGYVSKSEVSNGETLLSTMADAMIHRGPDAGGVYVNNGYGMSHRRLKVLDLSDDANQPMVDPTSKCAVVFNGEIYNFLELRKELEHAGCRFSTSSDTEVLLKGLILYGESFIARLEGDFAFAFRAPDQDLFLLARDRYGVKPLYVSNSGDILLFASEIRALTAAGVGRKLNTEKIAEYFRYRYVAGEHTLYEGVRHFPPAHYLKIQNGIESLGCYYTLSDHPNEGRDFAASFASAVENRLRADIPVGLFLSSGVDSASIAAQSFKSGHKLKTYTYSFNTGEPTNESAAAQKISDMFNFENLRINAPESDFLRLPEVVRRLEEPLGDAIIVANDVLFEKSKSHVGVALSGEGADELFSSYAHHRAFAIVKMVRKSQIGVWLCLLALRLFPLGLLNKFSFYPAKLDASLKVRIANALCATTEGEIFKSFAALFSDDELKHLLGSHYREDQTFYQVSPRYTDFLNWLPKYGLLRTDKLSMAHSLEVRVPFLSHLVVSSASALGFAQAGALMGDKTAFRRFCVSALGLPKAVLRQKKQPFFSPGERFLSDDYLAFVQSILTEERISKFGILNYRYVQMLLNEPRKNFLLSKKISSILIFQLWCEECLQPTQKPQPA